MKRITKWAEQEYGLTPRILATLLAGVLFVFLIPYVLYQVGPIFDQRLGLPSIAFGLPNVILGIILIPFGLIYAFWSIVAQLLFARGTPLPMMATKNLLISGPFRQCRLAPYCSIWELVFSSVLSQPWVWSSCSLSHFWLISRKSRRGNWKYDLEKSI